MNQIPWHSNELSYKPTAPKEETMPTEISSELKQKVGYLHWNFPIMFFLLVGLAVAAIFTETAVNYSFPITLPFPWLILPFIPFAIIDIVYFVKRAKRLETEILAGLPKGWHLIYKYSWLERDTCPNSSTKMSSRRFLKKGKGSFG